MKKNPKIKDIIIYSNLIAGDCTLLDIIQRLKSIANDTSKFEDIVLNLLEVSNIDKDIYISLFALLTSSHLHSVIDDLESYIKQ